jgi:hypothetical protein
MVSGPLFDLDTLAQEAEQFLAGAGELSQNLATWLGQFHPLSVAIASGVAAAAITAVHRRTKQNSRGPALKSWTESAFGYQPELGGPWLGLEY